MVTKRNPFTPSFGQIPPFMAGRGAIIEEIMAAFDNGIGDPNLSTIFVGARGTGKTALLSLVAQEAGAHGWVSANVSAVPGMLRDIEERTKEAAHEFITHKESARVTSITIGGALGLGWENQGPDEGNWRTRMKGIFRQLEEYDVGLLITVDEVRADLDEMVQLASVYQHFIREGKKVALLMAGLPHHVSALVSDESVSFLRRSQSHHFGRIDDIEIADALEETVKEAGRSIGEDALQYAVAAIDGFPYMMQLVGYRMWAANPQGGEITLEDARKGVARAKQEMRSRVLDATFRELSAGDRRFLAAMLPDAGDSAMADIALRMGVSGNYAAQYRIRLLEQGVIGERGRGFVGFELPVLKEYLAEKLQVS